MTHPATTLRNELKNAARAAYLDGATTLQIDTIVAYARASGRYDVLSGGRLTKRDAIRLIDVMSSEGPQAIWDMCDEELDDQDAEANAIADAAKARKASKKQKTTEKDAREAKALSELLADSKGERARHAKFGIGTVVDRDQKCIAVVFPGQPKPVRIMHGFYEILPD